ncbi:CRP-like cAMP-binding protein [Sphingomonas zeicaulis]|uniref:Crp/Fnr family transcriptional regulator n=1 Tax=Sphingomonas zeicaulis TaxID=1632740 RepID=UPI003D1D1CDA
MQDLSDEDRAALLSLQFRREQHERGKHLTWDNQAVAECRVVLDGFVVRSKVSPEGARQILGVHMSGDWVDLHNSLLHVADHDLVTLTPAVTASVDRASLLSLIKERPGIMQALWTETLIDAAISRTWLYNMGCQSVSKRLAHLLCELRVREADSGVVVGNAFVLPFNQAELAEAIGATFVHLNRTLHTMQLKGWIALDRGKTIVKDWLRLEELADFNEGYLHRHRARMTKN